MNGFGWRGARARRSQAQVEVLPIREPMVQVPDASMRLLEFVIASLAIVVAIVLGLAR